PVNVFNNGDIVFISGKYIIESSELHFAIAYASVVNNKNLNREFDVTDLPECVPHCVYLVTVNCKPKQIEDFIYFGAETIEYNSVTSNSDIKMDMTIVYPLKSPKFKYLATDIDYLKTSAININLVKSFSLATPNAPSIIDLIDDNLNSANPQTSEKSTKPFNIQNVDIENNNLPDSVSLDNKDYKKQSEDNKKTVKSDNEEDLYNEFEENQKVHLKKRKGNTAKAQKEKGKKVKK
ncbi:18855_t:CDS:2, partial [Dentiscutata erythropus]